MSENKTKEYVPIYAVAVYSLLFYAAWAVYHFFVIGRIEKLPNEILSSFLNDGVCKNILWTLPAVLLIGKYSDSLCIKKEELFTWKKEYAKYLLIFPAFAAYILLGIFVHKGTPAFSITPTELITVAFVGITEELVFRAWLLNATADRSEYAAIAVNSVMFLAIHFPRWITEGVFVTNFASLGFISIIVLSVLFSLIFLRTKNIALPIALHMFWDFLIFYLY